MKKILTLLILAFGSTQASAQQDPQFSQYMHNKLFINPAYAGMKKALCFSAIYRNQWNGFDGAPNSGVFSADIPLRKNGGAGFNFMYDKLGFESNVSFRGNYSYRVKLTKEAKLGIGIDLGGFSKRVGPSANQQWQATTNWQTDGVIPPLIKTTVLDMGFGLWFQNERLWAGISTTHLNGKKIDDGTTTVSNTQHSLIFQMARHYFITGGAKLDLGPHWEIKPSFLIKTDATITTFDLTALVVYDKRFWFGASYRMQDAICPMIGFTVPGTSEEEDLGLKVGFAYDYTTSKLSNYSNGSFELFVNYCMPFEWKDGGGFDVRNFR
ncbi:MAG: type IX secretion system membrane protein PorP/SprF [Bacteroidota bacterium]|nr:type IX secretion system membrane protein PorP/SprF [Bacteroidota bacterium]